MIKKERLQTLADYLRTLKHHQLQMKSWFTKNASAVAMTDRPIGSEYADVTTLTEGSCGYAACAVGHAGSIASFREAGFKVVSNGCHYLIPTYNGDENWDAVKSFFGLSEDEADHLFCSTSYLDEFFDLYDPTPTEVAERIENLVSP